MSFRFCTRAKSPYNQIIGDATVAAWGKKRKKFFLLGLTHFTLCLDQRTLLKIFSPATELKAIKDLRLFNQKAKLLPHKYTP
mgnify:CR=1 FL=1